VHTADTLVVLYIGAHDHRFARSVWCSILCTKNISIGSLVDVLNRQDWFVD